MNFREGTRRLALLAGGLGAIGGSFGSYFELKSALQQKALHNRFERLAASDDLTKERKCRLLGEAAGCSLDDFADIAEPVPTAAQTSMRADWKRLSKTDQDKFLKSVSGEQLEKFAADMGWTKGIDYDALAAKYGGVNDPYANLPDPTLPKSRFNTENAAPPASELNGKEIKTINWSEGKDFVVESIETEDGSTLRSTSLPSRWMYFWAVLLPIAGFVLPWGSIRAVQWVATGFLVKQG